MGHIGLGQSEMYFNVTFYSDRDRRRFQNLEQTNLPSTFPFPVPSLSLFFFSSLPFPTLLSFPFS